jgi:hypothetical protein
MRNTALRSPRYSNAQKEIKKYHPEIVETIWKNPTCWSLIGLYKLYMAYRIHGPSVRLRPPRFVTSQPWSPLATWRRTTPAVWVGWYLRANVGAFVGPPGMFHRGFPFTTHMLCVCVYIYRGIYYIYIHIHKNIYIHIYTCIHNVSTCSRYLASLMDCSRHFFRRRSEAWTTFTKAAFSERCWGCWPRVRWIPLWWEVKAGDGPRLMVVGWTIA